MSLDNKVFKEGDKVVHMRYGEGVVVKDVSNQYAEAYHVKYKAHTMTSSAGLMSHDSKRAD